MHLARKQVLMGHSTSKPSSGVKLEDFLEESFGLGLQGGERKIGAANRSMMGGY